MIMAGSGTGPLPNPICPSLTTCRSGSSQAQSHLLTPGPRGREAGLQGCHRPGQFQRRLPSPTKSPGSMWMWNRTSGRGGKPAGGEVKWSTSEGGGYEPHAPKNHESFCLNPNTLQTRTTTTTGATLPDSWKPSVTPHGHNLSLFQAAVARIFRTLHHLHLQTSGPRAWRSWVPHTSSTATSRSPSVPTKVEDVVRRTRRHLDSSGACTRMLFLDCGRASPSST